MQCVTQSKYYYVGLIEAEVNIPRTSWYRLRMK